MRKFLAMLSVVLLCGCQSLKSQNEKTPATHSNEATNANLAVRNNAVALLNDLLGDEKNVSKILLIKHHSDDLGKLIKEISQTTGNGAKMLEDFTKGSAVDVKRLDLPPGETAARKAISKTKEHLLLSSKDAEFEFQLLLTQVEALNYGANLALIAAESETDPARTRDFLRLSAELRDLQERVVAMLRERRQ